MRIVWTNAIIMLAAALAAYGSRLAAADSVDVGACSRVQSEAGVESDLVSKPPVDRSQFVAPERLNGATAGVRVVDVRRGTGRSPWRPEGALALSFLQLRILTGRTQDPIYVFGNGYDDARVARRIARWESSESERVRVVRSGAAGIALARSTSIERSELQRLLALPVRKVVSVGSRTDSLLAWFGSSDAPDSIQAALPEIRAAGFRSADEIAEWLGVKLPEADPTIVLVGDDPVRVGQAALDASLAIARPVFYISGDRDQIRRQVDRQARLVQGRSRVGGSPCR